MKIEKVNENQIRCTLTREDLAERQIKLSELAYGTEKAKMLFRDMMQQAAYEFGFEADDIPLMIEAIPLSADTIILVITKVEYPEELDTRFSRFSDPDPEDLYEDAMSGSVQNAAAAGADDILGLFRKIQEEHKKAAKEPEGDTQTAESSEKTAKEETPVNVLVDITKLFVFKNLDEVTRLAHILNGFYAGANDLYKSQTANPSKKHQCNQNSFRKNTEPRRNSKRQANRSNSRCCLKQTFRNRQIFCHTDHHSSH